MTPSCQITPFAGWASVIKWIVAQSFRDSRKTLACVDATAHFHVIAIQTDKSALRANTELLRLSQQMPQDVEASRPS